MPTKKLKILFIAPEVDPFVKAGGLGDVMRALPLALQKLGHDVRIVMPAHHIPDFDQLKPKDVFGKHYAKMSSKDRVSFYGKEIVLGEKIPVYLIENYGFFAKRNAIYNYVDDSIRYAFFCKAALHVPEIIDWAPDVVHSNDWVTGLVSNYLKADFKENKHLKNALAVFTIHNLAFQGMFNRLTLREDERDSGGELPEYDSVRFQTVNFMRRGIMYSDEVTTVSETYAKEIMTPKHGEGLEEILRDKRPHLHGIVHGVDYKEYDPATDKHIPAHYDVKHITKKAENKLEMQKEFGLTQDKSIPMIGLAHRLVGQKGLDLIKEIAPALMKRNVQLFVTGEGSQVYHELFYNLSQKYPEKVIAHLKFDRVMARKVFAASDMFLMPSHYEPCGISQLFACRYGSIPVVRATGGLADTIQDFDPDTMEGNGFVFQNKNAFEFYGALTRALETYKYPKVWRELVKNAMSEEFSWEAAAKKYEEVYLHGIHNKENGEDQAST